MPRLGAKSLLSSAYSLGDSLKDDFDNVYVTRTNYQYVVMTADDHVKVKNIVYFWHLGNLQLDRSEFFPASLWTVNNNKF